MLTDRDIYSKIIELASSRYSGLHLSLSWHTVYVNTWFAQTIKKYKHLFTIWQRTARHRYIKYGTNTSSTRGHNTLTVLYISLMLAQTISLIADIGG